MAKVAAYSPTHDSKKYNFAFPEEKAIYLCLMILVPIMIGLKIIDYSKYEAFTAGKDSSPLHDLFGNTEMGMSLRRRLLSNDETYDEAKQTERIKFVKLEDKLEILYDALFIKEYTSGDYEVQVGQMSFGSETRATLFRAVSTLSQFADYEV